jgi:hypothetical protein
MSVRIFSVLLVFACLETAGCSSQQRSSPLPVVNGEVAPGRIVVDILEPRGREHYYVYEVRPSKGSLDLTSEETFQDYRHERISHEYQRPAGAIGGDCMLKKPTAESPDGNFIAGCSVQVEPSGQFSRKYFQIFFISDRNSGKEVFHWKLDEQRLIHGFAWSPNSQSVALLNSTEVYGNGPLERISAWAGHPVPHNTVYLHIIPISTMQPVEYRIRSDVLYAFTRILNWSVD